MHTLLVWGYLQEIEQTLASNLIIPSTIHHIVYQYYFTVDRSKLLYLNTGYKEPNGLYIAQIPNKEKDENNSKWTISCNLYELKQTKKNDMCKAINFGQRKDFTKWNISNAGMTYTENLILPKHFISTYWQHNNENEIYHQYNSIFKCGGDISSQCWAIIMNETQFKQKSETNKTNMNAYLWTLPSLPTEITSNFLMYSHQFGLISVGGLEGYGFSNNIYRLSFSNRFYREENINKWKWKRIDSKLTEKRSLTTCIMINSQNNNYEKNEKLVVIGGYHYKSSPTVEMYDFGHEEYGTLRTELSPLNTARRRCGACYNNTLQRIYIGGGYGNYNGQCFEWYDIVKNKWFLMKKTTLFGKESHVNYPVLWIVDNNNFGINNESYSHCSVLCVASMSGIEYFDLREDKTYSSISHCNNKQKYNLKQLFSMGDSVDKSHCKLLL